MNRPPIEEIKDVLKHATPGPWQIWTSCSWRRFGSKATSQTVVEPVKQYDGHPDLWFRNGGEDGPDAQLIAEAPQWLHDCLAYIEHLESQLTTTKGKE